MQRPTFLGAFTIVELLVVVAIIVVLLAMLTPALDQAVYQAELAVCGANQKGITTGAISYAMSHRRTYPNRFAAANTSWMAADLRASAALDDRPKLTPFLQLKQLVDPLCEKVDLSPEANDPDCRVMSSYDLYFGFRFFDGGVPQKWMRQMGDRIEWQGGKFNVLVMEHERFSENVWAMSSHPDKEGKLASSVWQNRWLVPGVWKFTLSRWEGAPRRGPVDMNIGFGDGAVHRYNDVPQDAWEKDEAFSRVPNYASGVNFAIDTHQMPVE